MAKKAKRGRPSLFKNPVPVKLTLPKLVLAEIDWLAEVDGVERAEAIRRLLAKTKAVAAAFEEARL